MFAANAEANAINSISINLRLHSGMEKEEKKIER